MEAGGGKRGGMGLDLVDPADRGGFVGQLVSDFEDRRIGVETSVVGYILQDVLAPDEPWREGLQTGRIDPGYVARLITESLELAAGRAEQRDRLVIDVGLADPAFHEVVDGRYECDFPFKIC